MLSDDDDDQSHHHHRRFNPKRFSSPTTPSSTTPNGTSLDHNRTSRPSISSSAFSYSSSSASTAERPHLLKATSPSIPHVVNYGKNLANGTTKKALKQKSMRSRRIPLKKRQHQLCVPVSLSIWSFSLLLLSVIQIQSINYRSLDSAPSSTNNLFLPRHSQAQPDFDIEIFSAPKPFIGPDSANQRRAIRSWLRLKPPPKITLLGNEIGYAEIAEEFGLSVEHRVDQNFLGVPLFNSMFERANASTAKITVLINGDILLFDDFMATLSKVYSTFQDFLIVSARFDVDSLPEESENEDYGKVVRDHVWAEGTLHTYGGMDVWAWNTNGPRLFNPIMPHFIFGRGKYDNWLTHETIAAKRRHVIDVSETCLTVHVRHDYHFVTDTNSLDNISVKMSKKKNTAYWSKGKKTKFELFINIYLSLHVGTYINQMGNVLFAPWKFSRCMQQDGICIIRRVRPGICSCEASSFVHATQTDPTVRAGSRLIRCGMISLETKANFTIPIVPPNGLQESPAFGLPLTMRSVTDKVVKNGTVLLTAVNYGYRGMLMNWVCNMRQLNITNFVIAALDENIYKFVYTRGLPTYYENTIFQQDNADASSLIAGAVYGTDAFKLLTKMKSRVVLRFLEYGVNVIWTDCDIIYFKNPILHIWEDYGENDLVIQTNAPDNENANGKRRLNSGFYLAKSNARTIKGFKNVIKYASKSKMSEQPCFYDVLCGKKGELSVGDDECHYKDGMKIKLLDRHKYPNGLTNHIWNTTGGVGSIKATWPDLVILHNNWVKGGEKKPRFQRHGFVLYDSSTELCTYPDVI